MSNACLPMRIYPKKDLPQHQPFKRANVFCYLSAGEITLKMSFNWAIMDAHDALKMMDGLVLFCLCGVCWPSGIDTKLSDSVFVVVVEHIVFVDKCIIHWFLHRGVFMELCFIVVASVARDSAGSDLSWLTVCFVILD